MDFEIKGGNLPVLICKLSSGEQMMTESGGMSWMSPNMVMETTSNGGFGKAFGRMFSGEKFFRNIYTANGDGMIAFASSFPGEIKAFNLAESNLIFQKSAYLASQPGVTTSVYFQKKIGAGLFGGEGFIMEKAEGDGYVFLEFDGSIIEYDLEEGQQILVNSGHLAAMSGSCSMDIQTVKGLKNKLFGGEGFFNTLITGPGKVMLQTMPIQNVAAAIDPYITKVSASSSSTSFSTD